MYVIAPADKVKGENAWPQYDAVLRDLEQDAFDVAKEIWPGYQLGGLYPNGAQQYGICPLRQNEMAVDVNATTLSGSYTFKKNLQSTGWHNIFNYDTREDTIHAIAGFLVSDSVLRLLQMRFEISDKVYPIIDIQQAKGWAGFAILFKEDKGKSLVIRPRNKFLMKAYVEATGYQTIIPLGFMLYKTMNLVISET